jgi:hypothetical protein
MLAGSPPAMVSIDEVNRLRLTFGCGRQKREQQQWEEAIVFHGTGDARFYRFKTSLLLKEVSIPA